MRSQIGLYINVGWNATWNIVPYNLQMIMDWDTHLNMEYSGSAYCALFLYKYCYKGAARKRHIDLGYEQEHDSLDEIKMFIYSRIMCSMVAVWRMYGYQDYPAPELPVCAFNSLPAMVLCEGPLLN
jgi:hypothetical protein